MIKMSCRRIRASANALPLKTPRTLFWCSKKSALWRTLTTMAPACLLLGLIFVRRPRVASKVPTQVGQNANYHAGREEKSSGEDSPEKVNDEDVHQHDYIGMQTLFPVQFVESQFMHLPVPKELQKEALSATEAQEVFDGTREYKAKSYFPYDLETYANEAMLSWFENIRGRYNETAYEEEIDKYLDSAGKEMPILMNNYVNDYFHVNGTNDSSKQLACKRGNLRGSRRTVTIRETVSVSCFAIACLSVWLYVACCTTYFTRVPVHALKAPIKRVKQAQRRVIVDD
ncbi:unnamed protein product [Amoebophrya sp. A25]|nr:unnamed protein product [Amoebophrya sp. A25]|eukprot:GSA25T00013498001.1